MEYEFENKIVKWLDEQHERLSIPVNTINIPTSREIYFESKLYEIYQRYQSARIIINAIDNNKDGYWCDVESYDDDVVRLNYNGLFLENMIINYNIVVDLTWIITFLSIEICHYEEKFNTKFNFNEVNEIKKTKEVIKKIEEMIKSPDSEKSIKYFNYFNSLFNEYIPITTYVKEFWKSFKESEIRGMYNFIKHRGKPEYEEIYKIIGKKFYSYKCDGIEYSCDMNDVRKEISLYDYIDELIEFDDNVLFPYCNKLFDMLIDVVY